LSADQRSTSGVSGVISSSIGLCGHAGDLALSPYLTRVTRLHLLDRTV
jgi:hypothetical protein